MSEMSRYDYGEVLSINYMDDGGIQALSRLASRARGKGRAHAGNAGVSGLGAPIERSPTSLRRADEKKSRPGR